jgi:hypothetical protein
MDSEGSAVLILCALFQPMQPYETWPRPAQETFISEQNSLRAIAMMGCGQRRKWLPIADTADLVEMTLLASIRVVPKFDFRKARQIGDGRIWGRCVCH